MEQIIAKLQEVIHEAHALVNEYKGKIASLTEREELISKKSQEHHDRALSLDQRESAIEVQENIKEAQQKNEAILDSLTKEREEFESKKANFKTWQSEQQQLIDNGRKELADQQKQLDHAKAHMEEEVFKKIKLLAK